ncbi:hypothetical protein BIW11_04309 [Tropilaelaps mercedesae]|uniref:Uncharacterized protein n=1 Tax=Tropilaelaps mercedesae TaxID=418985 RepID=A0A1V9X8S4_9ACAR|nr:hypothetical protein BIW11_04309 [Tropilaelaps mercedesae]
MATQSRGEKSYVQHQGNLLQNIFEPGGVLHLLTSNDNLAMAEQVLNRVLW